MAAIFILLIIIVIFFVRSQDSDSYFNHCLERVDVLKFLFCLFICSLIRSYEFIYSASSVSGTVLGIQGQIRRARVPALLGTSRARPM